MVPESGTFLCLCHFYRCYEHVDPQTGIRGVKLPTRQFRSHQSKERQNELQARLQEQESATLARANDELTRAIDGLTLEDLPPGAIREVRASQRGLNTIERVSMLVKALSSIIDDSDQHISAAQAFYKRLESPWLSLEDVETAKNSLREFNQARVDLEIRLDSSRNRSKDNAVLATYHTAANHVAELEHILKNCDDRYNSIVEDHRLAKQSRDRSGIPEYITDSLFHSRISELKPVVQLVLTMVVACHIVLGLPRRGCDWIFSICHYIVETIVVNIFKDNLPPYLANLVNEFPHDLDAAISTFNISTKETIYAVCPNPNCHATYAPHIEGKIRVYPLRCTYRKYRSRCGQLLVRQKRLGQVTINVPIKTYITFDLDNWVAELLSRPGYEKSMDAAWDRMAPRDDGIITDIFQGSVVRDFMGPTKTLHFSKSGGEHAGRYLFSLGFDFFNPGRNLHGGKSVSIGAISLVCLNLPIEIRYKVENIFLAGIVPGPKEPPLDTINGYIRPLVDALLQFWSPGIWFTKTREYALGRLILCAIILIVCDLPGARKIGGFAAHNAQRFCTVCHCHKGFKSPHSPNDVGLNNYDVGSWHPRTTQNWRRSAKKWLKCACDDERKDSVNRTGVRFSELLRLPYYQPSRFLVVDPMHNLFLGLVHEHFRNILGYDPKKGKSSAQRRRSNGAPNITGIAPDDCPGRLPSLQLVDLPHHRALTDRELAALEKLKEAIRVPVAGRTKQQLAQKYSRSLLPALIWIGQGLNCLPMAFGLEGLDSSRKKVMNKQQASQALAAWRFSNALPGDLLGFGVDGTPTSPPTVDESDTTTSTNRSSQWRRAQIFTDAEMEEIWNDLEDFITPSWVASVSRTFLVSGPSLKSDQWRMVGSLYLPVTLTRLWAQADQADTRSLRRREYLDLTMSLASAVIIAASRITSTDHAQQYMFHMTQYRRKLRDLFPNYTAHCNHHMAMHIPQFLEMFGPVHGWWTFPTERMNGMLQRISTSHRLDETGETIARTWHRSAGFRAAILKVEDSAFIRGISHYFQRLTRTSSRNSLADDRDSESCDEYERINDFKTFGRTLVDLDSESFTALKTRLTFNAPVKVTCAPYVRYRGKTYSTATRHQGNSNVFTRLHCTPVRIESILRIPKTTDIWLMVRKRKPAKIHSDPFHRYPFLRTSIWSRDYENELEAILLSEVDTHFATLDMVWEDIDVSAVSLLSPKLYIQKQEQEDA